MKSEMFLLLEQINSRGSTRRWRCYRSGVVTETTTFLRELVPVRYVSLDGCSLLRRSGYFNPAAPVSRF